MPSGPDHTAIEVGDMLCERCWNEDARVHFAYLTRAKTLHARLCLACAQDESLTWLLSWAHRTHPATPLTALPAVVRVRDSRGAVRPQPATLVATGMHVCSCGCQAVLGAELSCRHTHPAFTGRTTRVLHRCHCGREHVLRVPHVACSDCGAQDRLTVIATAQTCRQDRQHGDLVTVEDPLRNVHAGWDAVSLTH